MKKQRSKLEMKRTELAREGEPEGAEYQALKRAAERLGVKPSDKHARLRERLRRFLRTY